MHAFYANLYGIYSKQLTKSVIQTIFNKNRKKARHSLKLCRAFFIF